MDLTNEQIDKVKLNYTYTSWKALCDDIGIKYQKAQKAQSYAKLELKRYFDYTNEKGKRKITIHSRRDIPLAKIPRGYNPYGNLIEILLINELMSQKNRGHIFLSTSKLLLSLSMINDNYNYFRYNVNALSKLTDIERLTILEWYSLTHSNLKSTLESTLNRLRDKSLIMWNYSVTICCLSNSVEVHTKANDEERADILRAEKEVQNELGINTISEIVKRGKYVEFINKVNKKLLDNYNIKYYYNSYEIVVNPKIESLQEESHRLEEMLQETKLQDKAYQVNNIVLDKSNNNVKGRNVERGFSIIHDKKVNDIAVMNDMITRQQKKIIRCNEDYLDNGLRLNSLLLDINTDKIRPTKDKK